MITSAEIQLLSERVATTVLQIPQGVTPLATPNIILKITCNGSLLSSLALLIPR